jgi:uncharacterized protein YegL
VLPKLFGGGHVCKRDGDIFGFSPVQSDIFCSAICDEYYLGYFVSFVVTNNAEAIDACHQSLQLSPTTDAKNLILLITDGDPSEPKETSPEFAATQAAEEAKAAGTFIIPVMIAETLEPETVEYMKGISSDGSVFNVTEFKSLQMLQDTLITHVSCQT